MPQATTVTRTSGQDRPTAARERGFRGDVEGLRAVAVGLVLLYHAGLPVLSGGFVGVDVFFVISGFLITSLLVRELGRTGRISLAGFYARRARRLLPAVAVVLLSTVALTFVFVPRIRWELLGGDVVAAALYFVNWRLADRSVDYLAEDTAPSVVQHFWSLAVEEQFYLVWPILLLLATWWARRRGRSLTGSLLLGLGLIAIPSLIWSMYLTAHEPAKAFFVTTTRMWELAIGAAVAVLADRLARIPRMAAVPLAWAGLVAIVVAGFVVSVGTPWPGYADALPTLGTAAVIGAGVAAGRAGPVVLLGTAGFRWMGALSYSLYLWHWPLLVVATTRWGPLPVEHGLAIAAVSFLPAWLTYRLVENPVRYSPALARSPRLALAVGLNCTMAGVAAGLCVQLFLPTPVNRPIGPESGAAALDSGVSAARAGAPVDVVDWITPDPLLATEDVPKQATENCQQSATSSTPVRCAYGNPNADVTVALVGDSKILQWLPAFQQIGAQNNWQIITYTKTACPFSAAEIGLRGQPYSSCDAWNERVLDELTGADRPGYVVTSQGLGWALKDGNPVGRSEGIQLMADGLRSAWSSLTQAGIKVVVLADTPKTGMNVYECVADNREHLTRCTYDRANGIAASAAPTQLLAAQGMADVEVVDLTDAICPTPQCAPVIGNVLVYRQGSHLTATYITTLAPMLEEGLTGAGLPTLESPERPG